MTDLEIRRIPFAFDDTVPFQWHPTNLQFGFTMNVLSVMAVAFEKYIVAATRMAMPLIDDPAVAAEADAFLRQEAQHARAHRLHLKALSAQYPEIETILDDAVASFDRLIATKPLKYHLAYVAALESVSTPGYKSILDQHEELLAPGEARVASMLAWHFVEEVEHRSSALIVYNSVIGDDWYKLSVWPRAMVHVFGVAMRAVKGFGEHLSVDVTGVDPMRMDPVKSTVHALRARISNIGRRPACDPIPGRTPHVAKPVAQKSKPDAPGMRGGKLREMVSGQLPGHDPADQPLPPWADEWRAAYVRGDDMTAFVGTVA